MSTQDTFFVQNDNTLIMAWLKCRRLIFFEDIFTNMHTQIFIHAALRGLRTFSQLNTQWILCRLYRHFIMREFSLMKACFRSIHQIQAILSFG